MLRYSVLKSRSSLKKPACSQKYHQGHNLSDLSSKYYSIFKLCSIDLHCQKLFSRLAQDSEGDV